MRAARSALFNRDARATAARSHVHASAVREAFADAAVRRHRSLGAILKEAARLHKDSASDVGELRLACATGQGDIGGNA